MNLAFKNFQADQACLVWLEANLVVLRIACRQVFPPNFAFLEPDSSVWLADPHLQVNQSLESLNQNVSLAVLAFPALILLLLCHHPLNSKQNLPFRLISLYFCPFTLSFICWDQGGSIYALKMGQVQALNNRDCRITLKTGKSQHIVMRRLHFVHPAVHGVGLQAQLELLVELCDLNAVSRLSQFDHDFRLHCRHHQHCQIVKGVSQNNSNLSQVQLIDSLLDLQLTTCWGGQERLDMSCDGLESKENQVCLRNTRLVDYYCLGLRDMQSGFLLRLLQQVDILKLRLLRLFRLQGWILDRLQLDNVEEQKYEGQGCYYAHSISATMLRMGYKCVGQIDRRCGNQKYFEAMEIGVYLII